MADETGSSTNSKNSTISNGDNTSVTSINNTPLRHDPIQTVEQNQAALAKLIQTEFAKAANQLRQNNEDFFKEHGGPVWWAAC